MDDLAGDDALDRLPLLLAGPILRRTEADAVTVWVALKQPCQVHLQILETHHQGAQLGGPILQGHRETTALGQHLHVVAVTARASDQKRLSSDRLYAYDLQFTADQPYSLEQALVTTAPTPSAPHRPTQLLSYFAHQKPTFALPPQQLSDLKIVHGSCRKPHGAGFDTLPILDCLLERAASSPTERPHQLFLTGDQIYGDDVADPLLWLASPLGDTLLGWEESLPVNRSHVDDERDHTRPQKLPAGKRDRLATRRAGLTAGLTDKSERVTSHLLSFGEYCAAYLLAYSPACWPARLPAGRAVTTGRKTIRRWDKDQRNMKQFLHTLWKVRRLLANIPTYSIFDDHDVSDDWNLNQAWCLRVLGKPLGRRTVQNAMLAYAVFQAWGNTPEQFEAGASGAALLAATKQWSHSAGQDQQAAAEISTRLGLPPADPHTGLPQFIQDKHTWIFKRSSQALTWHYTIRSACHEVVVLDTRTWRGYPIDAPPIAPPSLLSPIAFQQQLDAPLSQISPGPDYATFVIAPTNVFGMRVLDRIQQWHLDRRKVFTADVGDSWNLNDQALATLLTTLFRHRQKIIVLSGDIHYSSAVHLDYHHLKSDQRATLVQLTASAIKNEELLTQVLHTRLKEWLLPEKPRRWVGWSSPPGMVEHPAQPSSPPDWHCQLTWMRRQPAQPVDISTDIFELVPSQQRSPLIRSLKWLKFWNARWFQSGQEVVGVNNIALVHFASPDLPTSPSQLTVTQDHYWFSSWLPTQIVRSRFQPSTNSKSARSRLDSTQSFFDKDE